MEDRGDKKLKKDEEGFVDLYYLMGLKELEDLNPTSRDIVDCINDTNKSQSKEFRMKMHRDENNVDHYAIKTVFVPNATTYVVCRL